MDYEESKNYIEAGKEGRHLEYKRSTSWKDPNFKATLTKSILAMSNLKDGGVIVIGVEKQKDGSYIAKGIKLEHLKSFRNEDEIKMYISNFADPYVDFSIEILQNKGSSFVLIDVKEFEEIPVICKRNGLNHLKEGVIFIRTRRHPETMQIPSQTEMREIVELAIDKGTLKLKKRGYKPKGVKTHQTLLDNQLTSFELMRETLNKIKSCGYWRINIRPLNFEKEMITSLSRCEEIIENAVVKLRGWPYPVFHHNLKIQKGQDWIQTIGRFEDETEIWRFFQSSQFIHYFALREDWEMFSSTIKLPTAITTKLPTPADSCLVHIRAS